MESQTTQTLLLNSETSSSCLHCLQEDQIKMIDEALASICDNPEAFGEIHLVVEKGRLRFMRVERSFDVLRWPAERVGKSKHRP